jgi:hypothetical protein
MRSCRPDRQIVALFLQILGHSHRHLWFLVRMRMHTDGRCHADRAYWERKRDTGMYGLSIFVSNRLLVIGQVVLPAILCQHCGVGSGI